MSECMNCCQRPCECVRASDGKSALDDVIAYQKAQKMRPVVEALEAIRILTDWAYETGFHEMGYDPVQRVADALGVGRPSDWVEAVSRFIRPHRYR